MLPSVAILMVTLINPVAFTGFATIQFGALGVALGLGIPTALYGVHFDPQDLLYMNVAAGAFLLSYFTLFAHACTCVPTPCRSRGASCDSSASRSRSRRSARIRC